MPQSFSAKLAFALKALSLSRSHLAAELGVDKSVVGRWVTGAVKPSAHNLSRLTAMVAERVTGFTVLDWDRNLESLAELMGVDAAAVAGAAPLKFGDGMPLALLEQALAVSNLRGGAYEGFFRSTRPYAQQPGQFVHDHVMVTRQPNGLLRFDMGTGGVFVEGWALTLQTQLFCIGAELTSGSLVFAILNGVNTLKAGAMDGLILSCSLDVAKTPTSSAVVFERIGDLSEDPDEDRRRFCEMANLPAFELPEAIPAHIRDHLVRDIGPSQLAMGGDWLLRMPIARSMSRGLTGP